MGRIGALFRKSSDKEKSESPSSSNPYAQQPPQNSPPPGYDQYNQNQYNDNQYHTATSQNTPFGLPAGPRPGGLPGRVAPGRPPQTKSFESTNISDQPHPPRYSPAGSQLPPYSSPTNASGSAGGSPAFPSPGSGYSREKFGAQDGFGRNRYDPAPSPYGGQSPAPPSQNPGGYGNLNTESGGLFANYHGPPPPAPSPNGTAPDISSARYDTSQPMTEEERQEAGVQDTKGQIVQELRGTSEAAERSEAKMDQVLSRILAHNDMLRMDGSRLATTEQHMQTSGNEIGKGKVNLSSLDSARSMMNFAGNSKKMVQSREQRKLEYDRNLESTNEAIQQEEEEAQRQYIEMQASIDRQQVQDFQAKGLLGRSKADFSRFEFEDDTGEQRALNEKIAGHEESLLRKIKMTNEALKFQSEELERQNNQIQRITEKAEINQDNLWRNRVHLDTKHGKK